MTSGWVTVVSLVAIWVINIIALGLVPERRRPTSAMAWLLLIFFLPGIGIVLYLLIGSPYVPKKRREEQRADARNDFTLHVSLLTEDELTKIATVIHRIAEKLDVPVDEKTAEEVEKNIDPEQVLDALEQIEGDSGAPGHPRAHDAGAARGSSAMKASTAS